MHVVWDSHQLKPPSSQATRSNPKKANEEKEMYHYFTHPAEDHANFHPHFKQRERMGTWEKEETHIRSKKK